LEAQTKTQLEMLIKTILILEQRVEGIQLKCRSDSP
jgi:hypothetical protein